MGRRLHESFRHSLRRLCNTEAYAEAERGLLPRGHRPKCSRVKPGREVEMKRRNLGNSGLEVAPLAFGGNVFGWTVGEDDSFKLLDAFVSSGFDLIDTADIYPRWVPGNQGG